MRFDLAAAFLGALAGAIAAVSGFGIGSLLTPLLAWRFGTKVAVALVSVPHFAAPSFGWRACGGGSTGASWSASAS